jgi:hypothetical protein
MAFWDITAGGILGLAKPIGEMAYSQFSSQQQFNRQKELMALQLGNQQKLNQEGHNLQMDMWNKTNFRAQVQQMKAAGLNPSLMYGKGGTGGVTGSQTGGSAASGQASMAPMMDLANLNLAKTSAEIKLLQSQANLNNTQANKTGGVDTDKGYAEIEVLKSQVKSNEAKAALDNATAIGTNLDNKLKAATFETRANIATEELKLYQENVRKAIITNGITESQAESLIEQEKQKVFLNTLQMQLIDSQIGLTEEQSKAVGEQIKQGWAKIDNEKRALSQTDTKLGLETRETIVKEKQQVVEKAFKEFQQNHPSTSQTIGKMLNEGIGTLQGMVFTPWRY